MSTDDARFPAEEARSTDDARFPAEEARTTDDARSPDDEGRDENDAERLDRNYGELLQELRVAETGVQILFAFLLTVAFSDRFVQVSSLERWVYGCTLLASACAAALFIGPVSYHRRVFRQGRKAELVRVATLYAEIGLVCLVLAVVGTVFLALDVVAGAPVAGGAGAGILSVYLVLWYLLPILDKHRRWTGRPPRWGNRD